MRACAYDVCLRVANARRDWLVYRTQTTVCVTVRGRRFCECASNMPFRLLCITSLSLPNPVTTLPGTISTDGSIVIKPPVNVTDELFANCVNRIYGYSVSIEE